MTTPDSSLVELSIERPVAGGRMMARLDGRVVFVAGAVPGERVRALITRRAGTVPWADTRQVIEARPDRRDASHHPRFGGSRSTRSARLWMLFLRPRQATACAPGCKCRGRD